ncbi:LysR family transcriptional regulator [Bailinhaonella thermotolerans]|uniref:LysR family transcriptional regulator n=1 Tax=Bailinhaonella thermotolerans TaxID=1070861 RepID=A0A3A4BMZ5_9ACTN|nr:LysR family transcriptional regulator [Bailinhaonella thermotolerans]RJL32444.1 LysR family transcriptional regulator [Bailinhaonella thermotolerans]
MLDVRRLRLLRELAHRGTIAAVAEALAYTPSAVSQQLAVLETEAGVPLLERTGRRVTLTPAALTLVDHAEAVLERLERAEADLAGARRGPAGPLRVGTFPSAARAILPAALAALAAAHPALEPLVEEVDPAAVADRLRAGELDVALIHHYDFVPRAPVPGLASAPLLTEPLYLATPAGEVSADPASVEAVPAPAAPASGGEVLAGEVSADAVPGPGGTGERAPGDGGPLPGRGGEALRACRDAPWILAVPGTLCHAMTVRACEAAGFTPRARHHVDDFDTVLALVSVRQGVALVPELAIAAAPANVTLRRLPLHRRTEIAHRDGAARHPAVAAFSAALRAAVPPALLTPALPAPA